MLRFATILFWGIFLVWPGLAQEKRFQFARLGVGDGLSHNMVNDFLKDRDGFMWFATASGLNRYDGYVFKVFQNRPGDTTSVLVNDVSRIYEGPNGKLWLYTNAGNNVYDPRTESFIRNTNALLNEIGVSEGLITFINKDRDGDFWFIHYNQGLFRFDPDKKTTTRLQHTQGDDQSIASNSMSEIADDADGNHWIIHTNGVFERLDGKSLKVTYRNTELKERFRGQTFEYRIMVDADGDVWMFNNGNNGCFYFDTAAGRLHWISNQDGFARLNSNIVRDIVQDNNGLIWVATDHGGINLIDKTNGFEVHYILHDEEDPKSLSQNSINCTYKDRDGIIWIGTFKNGISYYHENIFRFHLYRHHKSKPESLPFNDINAFAEDDKGNLWIGTNGGGLIYFDRKANRFTRYRHDSSDPGSISNDVIVSLCMDHQGILWIGTYFGGLNRFDGKRFHRYRHDSSNPKSLGDDSVWEIMEDSNHNLWIGTLRGGVDVFDRSRNEFIHYRSGGFNSIHTDYVPALMEDADGNVWVGTGYGLEVLEKETGRFVHYLNDVNDPTTLSHNNVLSILQDSRGMIWVGTHNGLNLFDPGTKTFRVFRVEEGLPHNMILTLLEDKNGDIWMSTPNGLSRLSISGEAFTFRNYDESDGLQGKAFNENAALKCSTGELVYGGANGFNIFNPTDIRINTVEPIVLFTDFQVFNRSVRIGEEINNNVVLTESISKIPQITLKPTNNVFSIEFAALSFFHPEKSQYKYMLEGFNKEWLTTDASQRRVTFTNLDPGDYTLKVKASNNDGVWNEVPASLKFTILPPFWKSNIAFALYAVFIIGALLLARWIILTKERANHRIQLARQEALRQHELDMMKIRFFTNVSHEFRTPLSLILTPLEKLIEQTPDQEQQSQFQVMHRNAKRLLNMVNQLLDFRKIEVQELRLNTSEGDIVRFLRDLVHSFSDLSERKNIKFSFTSSVPQFETFFDQDKLEKIMFNLLSNAFKFTPENGNVGVELNLKEQDGKLFLEIRVRDTGIGISPDKHERIFERFFQDDLPRSLVNQGSGIGLSITREFVRLHGGSIRVESELGKGSCFIVLLPASEIRRHEIVRDVDDGADTQGLSAAETIDLARKPVLLLVEDNEDFRSYLAGNLGRHYSIVEAANGKQGLQKALALIPDLIVTDVMMPEMNGLELCRRIRADHHTSHIPIIVLTARTAEEQKLEGFEAGASDYITKPFNLDILQARVKNVLEQRERFQKIFQKHLDIKASEIQVTSLDEKLIQRAVKTVEDHISDPDFSVEELSREMGMSRVHLYKKLLALTGKTPIEFVRTIRLQRAAQLLEKSQLTVSEVAYQVGFNNPKYFTKYFKDQFQVLPSAYAASKRLSVE